MKRIKHKSHFLLLAIALLIFLYNFMSGYNPKAMMQFFPVLLFAVVLLPIIIVVMFVKLVRILWRIMSKRARKSPAYLPFLIILFFLSIASIPILPEFGKRMVLRHAGHDNLRMEADLLMIDCEKICDIFKRDEIPQSMRKLNPSMIQVYPKTVLIITKFGRSYHHGFEIIAEDGGEPSTKKYSTRIYQMERR